MPTGRKKRKRKHGSLRATLPRTGRVAPEKADAVATEAASRTPLNMMAIDCWLPMLGSFVKKFFVTPLLGTKKNAE